MNSKPYWIGLHRVAIYSIVYLQKFKWAYRVPNEFPSSGCKLRFEMAFLCIRFIIKLQTARWKLFGNSIDSMDFRRRMVTWRIGFFGFTCPAPNLSTVHFTRELRIQLRLYWKVNNAINIRFAIGHFSSDLIVIITVRYVLLLCMCAGAGSITIYSYYFVYL